MKKLLVLIAVLCMAWSGASAQMRVCYTPADRINVSEGTYVRPATDLWVASTLNADIHLWVLPHLLWAQAKDIDDTNKTALGWYKEAEAFAQANSLDIVGKLPFWNRLWFHDQNPGIYDPSDERFLAEAEFQAEIANRCIRMFPHIKRWVIGNEPQLEGSIYGQMPGLASERHKPLALTQISHAVISRVVPPPGVKLYGPALAPAGISRMGMMEPHEFAVLLWDELSDHCVGLAINAYPTYHPNERWEWTKYYSKLPNIPWMMSEQGVRLDWAGGTEVDRLPRLQQLIRESYTMFAQFSFFLLRGHNDKLEMFSILDRDGKINRDLLLVLWMEQNNIVWPDRHWYRAR